MKLRTDTEISVEGIKYVKKEARLGIERTLQSSLEMCGVLISRIITAKKEDLYRFNRSKSDGCGCDAYFTSLSLNGHEFNAVAEVLESQLPEGMKCQHIRVHEFKDSDYCSEHADTAYEDCHVLILRLDSGPSRLRVEGNYMPEQSGVGYLLSPLTSHEVLRGTDSRYTLVAWCK